MRKLISICLFLVLAACSSQAMMLKPNSAPSQPVARVESINPNAFLQLDNETHLVDLTTGKDVTDFKPVRGGTPMFSRDSRKLAMIETNGQVCDPSDGGVACHAQASVLHIVDLQTRHEVTATAPSATWAGNFAFNADASRFAIAFNQQAAATVRVVDTLNGQTLGERAIDLLPSALSFVQDGNAFAIYGQLPGDALIAKQPPAPRVIVLNAATLETEWDKSLDNVLSGAWCLPKCGVSFEDTTSAFWSPVALFSPDGSQLYIVHADSDQLTTIDFSARTVSTAAIRAARSWVETLLDMTANVAEAKGRTNGASRNAVLSADGSRLFVTSQTMTAMSASQDDADTAYTVGDVNVIDVKTGQKIATHPMTNRQGVSEYVYDLNLTPDGTHLFVVRGDDKSDWWTEVFDANTLTPTARLDNWRLLRAHQRDGHAILVAHQPSSTPMQLGLVDDRTFQIARSWSLDTNDFWVSP